jgi:methyltransferase (TIGR00027 family)
MKQSKPSRTSEITAIMRALHQTADDEPRILTDPIAPRLIETGGKNDDWLAPFLNHSFAKRWRAGFLLRSRYAEDCLADAVECGAQQYLILGAGLDTFAYRQPLWAASLHIFEIDHPATQHGKRDRLETAGIAIPPNLTFVPIDFEKTSLAEALRSTKFSFNSKTFCSWLGVTPYLTPSAFKATLEFMLLLPQSSEIVFNFVLPADVLSGIEAEAMMLSAQRSAEAGEPWLTSFLPDRVTTFLRTMGFRDVIHLSPDEANRRYFQDRRDGLEARRGERLVRAIV